LFINEGVRSDHVCAGGVLSDPFLVDQALIRALQISKTSMILWRVAGMAYNML
jgi:hypothetical protein